MHFDEKLFRAILPDGTHLAGSRQTIGSFRGLALDDITRKLFGHAELVPLSAEDLLALVSSVKGVRVLTKNKQIVWAVSLIAVGVIGTLAVQKNVPKLKRWWMETSLPSIKRLWSTLRRVSNTVDEKTLTRELLRAAPSITPADLSNDIDRTMEALSTDSANKNAQEQLVAIVLAAGIIAEQLRVNPILEIDTDALIELRCAMDKLTTDDAVDFVNLALQSTLGGLDAGTLSSGNQPQKLTTLDADWTAELTGKQLANSLRLD